MVFSSCTPIIIKITILPFIKVASGLSEVEITGTSFFGIFITSFEINFS